MALPLNLANEWQIIGNTEPITLFRKIADGQFDAGTPVANAHSPGFRKDVNATGRGQLAKASNQWILWSAQTAGPPPSTANPVPKVGDVIRDQAGARWTVWQVDVQAWGWRFLLDTVKER